MPIHPSALIATEAQIDESATIGPNVVIGPKVTIGADVKIGPGACLNWATIGDGSKIGANAVIGGDPQVIDWEPVDAWVKIGSGVIVNELTVINRSKYENEATLVGDGSYIMAQAHIAHDCKLDEGVIISSLVGFSGHVEVGKYAVVGGAAVAHQFVRIGEYAMVGGQSRLIQDAAPYFITSGAPAKAIGLNSYALKKYKIPPTERTMLKTAYKILSKPGLPFSEALELIEKEVGDEIHAGRLLEFLKSSERGVTL